MQTESDQAPLRDSAELERRREWHGWAFRDYTPAQVEAVKHYLATGERTDALPGRRERLSDYVARKGFLSAGNETP